MKYRRNALVHTSRAGMFRKTLLGSIAAAVMTAKALTVTTDQPEHPVENYGPFVAGDSSSECITKNTSTLNSALDEIGRAGGGTVLLPVGTFFIAPTDHAIAGDWAAAINICYDHLTLRGQGIDKTVLRTRSDWSLVKGQVVRGAGIRIVGTANANAPRRGIVLADFTLDGGACYTGQFYWPASPKDGSGWDISHKGLILAADDWVDDVTLRSLYVRRFRGEMIYCGGQGLGKVRLSRVRVEDTNASTFNITADFLAEDCEFGKSRFWVEIATRFPGKSGTFRNCVFREAHVTGIALAQGDGKPQPYLFENCRFENAPGAFGFYGGVGGPVVIRDNIFTDVQTILSADEAPGATTPINQEVCFERNTIVRGGELAVIGGYTTGWLIQNNDFTGCDKSDPSQSTAVMYGAVFLNGCVIRNNRFADCRTPEQIAWVRGERPWFVGNVYEHVESRAGQGKFYLDRKQSRITPHFEQVEAFSLGGDVVAELEPDGYVDGQELKVRGGEPSAKVLFPTGQLTYSVAKSRALDGKNELHFRYNGKMKRWEEVVPG